MKITVSAVMTELELSIFSSTVKFVLEPADACKIQEQWPIKEPIKLTIETNDIPPAASTRCKTGGGWCCRHIECYGVDCCVHGSQKLPQNT